MSRPAISLAVVLSTFVVATSRAQQADTAIIGRWDLAVEGGRDTLPSWLEVRRSGNRILVGQFVGVVGSARPISRIEFADQHFRFSIPPQWDRATNDLQFDATVSRDSLHGTITDPSGRRAAVRGVRAPALLSRAAPRWTAPTALFNGRDLAGWHASGGNQWKVINGVLTSSTSGSNLVTDAKYTDFKLHVEFRYPAGGNSGVYLRGRYEVQIEDSRGEPLSSEHLGGIYGFLTPNEDAALAPGAWQALDITLVGRRVTVVLNGRTIICEQNIPGITGGALDSREGEPGPIMLQGDHNPIEYRKVTMISAQ